MLEVFGSVGVIEVVRLGRVVGLVFNLQICNKLIRNNKL